MLSYLVRLYVENLSNEVYELLIAGGVLDFAGVPGGGASYVPLEFRVAHCAGLVELGEQRQGLRRQQPAAQRKLLDALLRILRLHVERLGKVVHEFFGQFAIESVPKFQGFPGPIHFLDIGMVLGQLQGLGYEGGGFILGQPIVEELVELGILDVARVASVVEFEPVVEFGDRTSLRTGCPNTRCRGILRQP